MGNTEMISSSVPSMTGIRTGYFDRVRKTNREITMEVSSQVPRVRCNDRYSYAQGEPRVSGERFPDTIREIILKAHEGMNHPIDYIGSSLIAVAAAAVGNSIQVRMMADWIEKPIIYMAIVGEAGSNKSAPLAFAVKPLEIMDDIEMDEYNERYEEYREECEKAARSKGMMPEEPDYFSMC